MAHKLVILTEKYRRWTNDAYECWH